MTAEKLKGLLDRSFWSKDVVVWIGSELALGENLTGYDTTTLDILDLMDDDLPLQDDERRTLIQQSLDARLRELNDSVSGKHVLLVNNIGILSRYNIGLTSFFDWFAGSSRMVILCLRGEVGHTHLSHALSEDVSLDGDAIVDYLRSHLADPAKVFREKAS